MAFASAVAKPDGNVPPRGVAYRSDAVPATDVLNLATRASSAPLNG